MKKYEQNEINGDSEIFKDFEDDRNMIFTSISTEMMKMTYTMIDNPLEESV